jgi:hypothetical protein
MVVTRWDVFFGMYKNNCEFNKIKKRLKICVTCSNHGMIVAVK